LHRQRQSVALPTTEGTTKGTTEALITGPRGGYFDRFTTNTVGWRPQQRVAPKLAMLQLMMRDALHLIE
jgi:hypothetical protein